SKGMLDEAKKIANKNAETLLPLINKENPIIGIEPSAILSFRDEYVRLVDDKNYKNSSVAKHSYTIEEFLAQEIKKGIINSNLFTEEHLQIKLHGHCHQKAISEQNYTKEMLSLPKNYHVEILPTGCCGMAGSFGYEKEHYEVSMKVGNLVLFPAVRAMEQQEVICAPGTSCRHQIHDGTQRTALHPVEVLYNALK
ncbi:MAG: FAD-binding oxidoreductase, partial [Chitinophagales bacterium]